MNIAVVQGRVKSAPDRRIASDGSLLLSFDVVVARPEQGPPARGSATSNAIGSQVPVTWQGPEVKAPALDVGELITVVGSVHRRFYRRGGATASRTDVRAARVVRGAGVRAERAIADAVGPIVEK